MPIQTATTKSILSIARIPSVTECYYETILGTSQLGGFTMTRGLAFWVLMLIWLVIGIAWHFALFPGVAIFGVALIPFLLFALLGWQVFGPPLR